MKPTQRNSLQTLLEARFAAPPRLEAETMAAALSALGLLASHVADLAIQEFSHHPDMTSPDPRRRDGLEVVLNNRRKGQALAQLDMTSKYDARIWPQRSGKLLAGAVLMITPDMLIDWSPLRGRSMKSLNPKPHILIIKVMDPTEIRAGSANVQYAYPHTDITMELPHPLDRERPHLSAVTYTKMRQTLIDLVHHEVIHVAQKILDNFFGPGVNRSGSFTGVGPKAHDVERIHSPFRPRQEFYSYLAGELAEYQRVGGSPEEFIRKSRFFSGIKTDRELWRRAVKEFHRAIPT